MRALLLSALALVYFIAPAAARADASPSPLPGRVLHVSPLPLKTVDPQLQFSTISAAALAVQAGDRVIIHAGTYRESVTITQSGTPDRPIVFEPEPADRVIVSGAELLKWWRKEPNTGTDNIFSLDWPHSFLAVPSSRLPNDNPYLWRGRSEEVYVANYFVRQVELRRQLARGTFWIDDEHHRIYIWGSANDTFDGVPMEGAVQPVIWSCQGDYVQMRGLHFQYACNQAAQAATQFSGRGDVIDHCIFECMNGLAAAFSGADQIVRGCTFQENGRPGYSVTGATHLHLTGCVVRKWDE